MRPGRHRGSNSEEYAPLLRVPASPSPRDGRLRTKVIEIAFNPSCNTTRPPSSRLTSPRPRTHEDPRQRVYEEMQCDFGLEAMKQQDLEGRIFLMEAPHEHDVWRNRKLRDDFPRSKLLVGRTSCTTWATNSECLHQALRQRAEDSSTSCTTSVGVHKDQRQRTDDSFTSCTTSVGVHNSVCLATVESSESPTTEHERLAGKRIEAQDFSMSSCLRLLHEHQVATVIS